MTSPAVCYIVGGPGTGNVDHSGHSSSGSSCMHKITKTWFSIYAWDEDSVIGVHIEIMEPRARDANFGRILSRVLGFSRIYHRTKTAIGRIWDIRDPNSLEEAREIYYWMDLMVEKFCDERA